mgnify:CR=1 FL=1
MVSLDIDHDALYKDISDYVIGIIPEAAGTPANGGWKDRQIVKSAQNLAALPSNAIVMSILMDSDLDYGVVKYDSENGKAAVQNSVKVRLQLSFYGEHAEKRSRMVDTLWRTLYGTDNLKLCKPLYVQSRERHPYINESNQYEDRYILDLALQYNPQVTYAQDFLESAEIELTPVK